MTDVFRWRPGTYLKGSGIMFFWLGIRAAALMATVLIMTRALGASGYGIFTSTLAIASFLTPFAGMGLSNILLRDGARRQQEIPELTQAALRIWLWSTAICTGLALPLVWLSLPNNPAWLALLLFIPGEIASTSLSDLIGRSMQAQRKLWQYGAISALLPVCRLVLLSIYAWLGSPSMQGWFCVYAAASMLFVVALWRRCNLPSPFAKPPRVLNVKSGIPFSLAALSLRLQAEFNKPVLARQDLALTGNYSAAQRVTDLVSLPLIALQEALWPRVYAGMEARQKLLASGAFLILIAACAGVLLWLIAPAVPEMLGADFERAAAVLRWIAFLPLVQCLRNLGNNVALAAGLTKLAGSAAIAGVIISVVLVLSLVPELGLWGAVAATYLSEFAAILLLLSGLAIARKTLSPMK